MLNNPAVYLHFWIILISVPNLLEIGLMVLVFVLAILVPFPRGKTSREV